MKSPSKQARQYVSFIQCQTCMYLLDVVGEVGDGILVRTVAVVGGGGVAVAGVRDP